MAGGSIPQGSATYYKIMGYNTEFFGQLRFTAPLTGPQIIYLNKTLGQDCRDHPEWNKVFHDQPNLEELLYNKLPSELTYIDLEFTEDYGGLKWDGSEKTYDLVAKVNLLILLMRKAWPDFGLEGTLRAQGEEIDDCWQLYIADDGYARSQELEMTIPIHSCPECGHRFK